MVSLPPAMVEKAEQSSSRGRPRRFLTGFVLDFIVCLLVARLFKITASSEEYKSVMKFQANFYAALDDLGPWHIIQIYWNILSATFSQIWANWQNFAVYGRVFTAIGFVVFLPFIILGIFTETILALSADSDYLVKWLLPFLLVIVSWMVITIWSEQNEDRTVSLLDVIGIAFFMLFLPVTIAFVATFVKFGMLLCWVSFRWLGGDLAQLSFVVAVILPSIGWATGKFTEHTLTEALLKQVKRVLHV
jgi:hypothetical protein